MALPVSTNWFQRDLSQPVQFEEDYDGIRKVILNRPSKLNTLTYEMAALMLKRLQVYENDPTVNFVILKGNGKAFCAGGDVVANILTIVEGHWSVGASIYKKQLILDHLIATFKKPLVCFIHGIVMGGGAGLSMHVSFRIVTEKTVFAMPEASIGLIPDVGASYFLSRLPGSFGEYLGLTGARLDGAAMIECGLATHFVLSEEIPHLERMLSEVNPSSHSEMSLLINKHARKNITDTDNFYRRLKIINRCFSRETVEEILASLEDELSNQSAEKWIVEAVKSMKSASPTSLKIFLRSIREGRRQTIEQCLTREYTIFCNIVQRKITNDYYEGARAMLFDKDKRPKWEPAKLESVKEETVDRFFREVADDDDWNSLQLPSRSSHSTAVMWSKL